MNDKTLFNRKNMIVALKTIGGIILFALVGWLGATFLLGITQRSVNQVAQQRAVVESSNRSNLPVASTPEVMTSEKDGAEMIFIPPSEFIMGTNGGYANEKPSRSIFVEGFYMYKHEVTVKHYRKFLEEQEGKGHEPDPAYDQYMPADYLTNPKYDNYPIVNVSFDDAEAYCRWAGNRLPTEAEWEKGARGTDGRTYPWGMAWDDKKANWDDEKLDGFRFTAPVGSFPTGASPYGLQDMAGNAWEWVNDWYQPYPGNETKDSDYGSVYRVVRGGSWLKYPMGLTTSSRDTSAPHLRFNSIGFRCANTPR